LPGFGEIFIWSSGQRCLLSASVSAVRKFEAITESGEVCAIEKEKYTDLACLEKWLERKGCPLDLPVEEQEPLEVGFSAEYGNVRAALWERHYLSLDPAERALLDTDTHHQVVGTLRKKQSPTWKNCGLRL